MKDKLSERDIILIDKTTYSGKFALLFKKIGFQQKTNRNDILVFKKDLSQSDYYVKRCIALPGETISVHDGIVRVNRKEIEEQGTVKKSYQIYYKNFNRLSQKIKDMDIRLYQQGFKRNASFFNLSLNQNQLAAMKKIREIDSVILLRPTEKVNEKGFNMDEYVIPYAGMTIILNNENFVKYKSLITKFENLNFAHAQEKVMLRVDVPVLYTFKFGYVFLLGDNRNNSVDSRAFGVIPLENITGRYMLTL